MVGVKVARIAALKGPGIIEQGADGLLAVGCLDGLEIEAVHVVVALEEDSEEESLVGEFECGKNGMLGEHSNSLRNEVECYG